MSKEILFTKMAGAGNDFILVDNRKGILKNPSKTAKELCDRKFAVGGDGLILLERSKKADLKMRILNSDGSEAEMCGNGVRCFARFAFLKKIAGKSFSVETLAGKILVEVKGEIVKARMIDPRDLRLNFTVPVLGKPMKLNFLNTGVPHAVHFTEALQTIDTESLGKAIRFHSYFSPRGSNANFVKLGQGNKIEVRTYERGVEGETLACGTGSTASALVAAALHGLRSPVQVKTRGGETLKIYFSKQGDRFLDVFLEGPVKVCFEGRITK